MTGLWRPVLGLLLMLLVACSAPTPTPETSPVAPSPLPTLPPTLPSSPSPTATAVPTPQPSPAATDVPPTPTAKPTAVPPPQPVEHVVQPGESLLGLALEYEVPMAAIQLTSQMGEAISLQAGQVITIPPASEWAGASPYWLVVLIQAGDTLSGIASKHNLQVAALQEANGLEDGALLAVGQPLILPLEDPGAIVALSQPPALQATATSTGGGGGSSSAPPAPAAAPPPALPASVTGWPAEVYRLINQVRAANGLSPLAYNETLALAAQRHAQDCQQRGWCSHRGSDGSVAATRIAHAGYQAAGTAECWVQSDSPQGAITFWMDEVPPNDPHRRTLLSTYLTEVGIGVAATRWGYFVVADFARR